MSVPDPDHLLDQADRLIASTGGGTARQVDLRRAISNAYYALFHAVTAQAVDDLVGSTLPADATLQVGRTAASSTKHLRRTLRGHREAYACHADTPAIAARWRLWTGPANLRNRPGSTAGPAAPGGLRSALSRDQVEARSTSVEDGREALVHFRQAEPSAATRPSHPRHLLARTDE